MAIVGELANAYNWVSFLWLHPRFWLVCGLCIFFIAIIKILWPYMWGEKEIKKLMPTLADHAELQLHFYNDERQPKLLSHKNIWRWYWLRNIFKVQSKKDEKREHVIPNLFICFENPVRVGTIQVQSPDIPLPRHEVKEFQERFAIIVFHDNLSGGTLKISVS